MITRKILSVTETRKPLNTVGFIMASFASMALPSFRTSTGTVFCSSVFLGFLAPGRAAFAVNHLDAAPRYAGIVMGVSNTAGTLAGIVGVGLAGSILEAANKGCQYGSFKLRELEICILCSRIPLRIPCCCFFIICNRRKFFFEQQNIPMGISGSKVHCKGLPGDFMLTHLVQYSND